MTIISTRIDAITAIHEIARSLKPPCPKSVKIELTARCDMQCWFCATGYKLRDKRDMTRSFYDSLLVDLKESGVEEVGMFYLGESFLCKWLPSAIAEASSMFPYVFLTTNGRLATYDRVKECAMAGLNSLKFSFNFASAGQMKEMTKVDAFDTVVKNIKDARKAVYEVERDTGHVCGLFASSILYDGDQRGHMESAINEIRPFLDEHYFLPLYSQAGLAEDAVRKPVAGNPGRVGAMREPLPCWALFTEARVTYDGHLSACCFDHDGRFHMGDLKTTKFMDAWHCEEFQELRRHHLERDVTGTVCEKCAAYGG